MNSKEYLLQVLNIIIKKQVDVFSLIYNYNKNVVGPVDSDVEHSYVRRYNLNRHFKLSNREADSIMQVVNDKNDWCENDCCNDRCNDNKSDLCSGGLCSSSDLGSDGANEKRLEVVKEKDLVVDFSVLNRLKEIGYVVVKGFTLGSLYKGRVCSIDIFNDVITLEQTGMYPACLNFCDYGKTWFCWVE